VRRRYLRFRIASERKYATDEASDAILKAALHLYGVHGLSHMAPLLIDFDEEEQAGILRCSHTHLRQMRASLANITSIDESGAAIIVTRVSGTIRSLRSNKKTEE
jgi:RNase P/RNase MRP subunit POP5